MLSHRRSGSHRAKKLLGSESASCSPESPLAARARERQELSGDYAKPEPRFLDAIAAYYELNVGGGEISPACGPPTVFDAATPPMVSVRSYLSRLAQYMDCSQECFTMAVAYAERSNLQITVSNVHRLLLSGVVLAAKQRDDFYFSNHYYSLVGGVSVQEVNRLELGLLEELQWRALVTKEQHDEALLACDEALQLLAEADEFGYHSAHSRNHSPHSGYSDARSDDQRAEAYISVADSDSDSAGESQEPRHVPCWQRVARVARGILRCRLPRIR